MANTRWSDLSFGALCAAVGSIVTLAALALPLSQPEFWVRDPGYHWSINETGVIFTNATGKPLEQVNVYTQPEEVKIGLDFMHLEGRGVVKVNGKTVERIKPGETVQIESDAPKLLKEGRGFTIYLSHYEFPRETPTAIFKTVARK